MANACSCCALEDWQTGKQTNKQTNTHTYTRTYTCKYIILVYSGTLYWFRIASNLI